VWRCGTILNRSPHELLNDYLYGQSASASHEHDLRTLIP